MKNLQKFLLFCLALLVSTLSFAQSTYKPALQKGSTMVGGGMAFSFGNSISEYSSDFGSGEFETKYSSISFTPTLGSFVGNGIAVGVIVDLTSTTTKDGDDEETSTQYSFGPVFRYYAPGGFFVHGDVSFGKMIEKYSYDGDSEKEDANLLKWKVAVGYAIFLNEHVSIEPTMAYRVTQAKYEDDLGNYTEKLGEFVIGVGFNIFLHKNSQP